MGEIWPPSEARWPILLLFLKKKKKKKKKERETLRKS